MSTSLELGLVSENLKKEIGKCINVKGFIRNIKGEYDIEHYNNGASMFEWMLRYEKLHKISDIIENVNAYKLLSGIWNIPLLIDHKSNIAFIFMKENNLTRKRKEINNSKKINVTSVPKVRPPHYAQRLCDINKWISKQLFLCLGEIRTPFQVLQEVCPGIQEHEVPKDLRIVIVTFNSQGDDISKLSAGFYDNKLHQIYVEDWSEYIDTSSFDPLNNDSSRELIDQINNKAIELETSKDELTEFIDDNINDEEDEEQKSI
ncbi:MAG: DUF5986 family protein [Candidatus Gastranaerophilales bacterium]|nr:DUF5986 family protein [Candidatus Gastranaerophilales bacterium]